MGLTTKNTPSQQKYKTAICTKYKDSEICKLISNPNYTNENAGAKSEVEKLYAANHALYAEGKYLEVIANSNRADSLYPKSEYMPKFALLRAYAIGRTGTVMEYENALQRVIAKYPKDPVKQKAQDLLDAIKNVSPSSLDIKKDTLPPKADFVYEDKAEHFCMILILNKKINSASLKARLSDFNQEYFSLASLGVTSNLLDLESQAVLVKSFQGAAKAMDYYQLLVGDLKVFKDMAQNDFKLTLISTDNFARLFKEKKKTEYIVFFEENYKKKQ